MNAAAFDRVEGEGAQDPRYQAPTLDRYHDPQREDEGQARFDYQLGRSRLFAKAAGAPQRGGLSHPFSARQENYQEQASAAPTRISASCANCQECLHCGADQELFCPGCNVHALRPASSTEGHPSVEVARIPPLYD